MEENKNRINVEKKLKESMKKDRARIQIGEISSFGLLELSRQRLRPSIVENSSELCPHCAGSGRIQSIEVSAVQVLRGIEEEGASDDVIEVQVSAHSDIVLHILNKKRSQLNDIESRYKIIIDFINDNTIIPPLKKIVAIKKSTPKQPPQLQPQEKSQNNNLENDEKQNKRRRNKKSTKRRRNSDIENTSHQSSEALIKSDHEISKKDDNKNKNTENEKPDVNKETEKPVKPKTEKKTTKKVKKSKKINKDEEELQFIEKNSNAKEKNDSLDIREIKSSAPIEVVTIEDKVTKEKPKKKGWWSK
jgi:ribonuclease E